MGKNHRHKKQLKSEKAKVKLKTSKTKFLPKGQNVTDTNFKVKSIVLPQQLKTNEETVPLSKRKLNVPDLLSRLKHYNDNVRHGACEELHQMVKYYQNEIIQSHLAPIMQVLSSLIQDRESKVRKSTVKAIDLILELTPLEKMRPFFGYLSTNLRCAMTNINKNVQEDSLLLLDSFIKHVPSILTENSDKILTNFFALISKLRNDGVDRTLTLNLGSKLTSVKWRIKVLSRLYSILNAIIQLNYSNTRNFTNGLLINGETCNTILIYKQVPALFDNNTANFFTSREFPTDSKDGDKLDLFKHILTLVPLLYETWMEVLPEKSFEKAANDNTQLNEEASAILVCIMNILFLLYEYMQEEGKSAQTDIRNTFLNNQGKKFFNHLLKNFPYIQSEQSKHKKSTDLTKVLEIINDAKCVQSNLLICYIYTALNVKISQRKINTELQSITAYIKKCVYSKNFINQHNVVYLLKILQVSLNTDSGVWKNSGADLESILEIGIYLYQNCSITERFRLELFNILAAVNDNKLLNNSIFYRKWLISLPSLLHKNEIAVKVVDSLLNLARKNNRTFHSSFMSSLHDIIENLNEFNTQSVEERTRVRKTVVDILFYILKDDKAKLMETANFMRENADYETQKFYSLMLHSYF